ncbi:MAG: LacI family DNA-binding transcriptional regulator [Pararhodobacter sp.]
MEIAATPDPMIVDRPTTKDLARIAGVSRATVDRVLNAREGVTPATVDKVNAAIEKLGFERNISAANLAKGKTYRFLFVLPRSGDLFLKEILRHIDEAGSVFATERIAMTVQAVDENDPYGIAAFLGTLTPEAADGVAIMAPETPQVRDAILRLEERGVRALPFISNQVLAASEWVGIDNRAAGQTAATLLGRFVHAAAGKVLVISETMQSRDSLDRRCGFDEVLTGEFPHLNALPSVETYGSSSRARQIILTAFDRNPDIVGVYVLSSEARVPLSILREVAQAKSPVTIAHERTPFTENALREGSLDALITQDSGHLVRSAIRKLRALTDGRNILGSQEKIRVEVLLKTNL